MPTPTPTTSDVSSPFNADSPMFVATNALADTTNMTPKWTSGGLTASADITVVGAETSNAYDGKGEIATYGAGTMSTIYFNFDLNSALVNTIAILLTESIESSTITVTLADNADFSGTLNTDYYNIATFTTASGTLRRIGTSLPSTNYASTRYGRISFATTGGGNYSILPRIGEFYIGAARILSKGWDYGSDVAPRFASTEMFVARSGSRTPYVNQRGLRRFRHFFVAGTSTRFGTNDVATIRNVHADCEDGTKSVLYVPNPTSALGTAYLGYLPPALDMPREDYGAYTYDFEFDEVPPAFLRET